jgi:hypothetical protein
MHDDTTPGRLRVDRREMVPEHAQTWDAFYARTGDGAPVWSGEPNGSLVAEVAELEPGTALDVGCGEGADAIWLAQRGWEVTALDPSAVALERAATAAAESAVTVAWVHGGWSRWRATWTPSISCRSTTASCPGTARRPRSDCCAVASLPTGRCWSCTTSSPSATAATAGSTRPTTSCRMTSLPGSEMAGRSRPTCDASGRDRSRPKPDPSATSCYAPAASKGHRPCDGSAVAGRGPCGEGADDVTSSRRPDRPRRAVPRRPTGRCTGGTRPATTLLGPMR